jgi:hypothetical protein
MMKDVNGPATCELIEGVDLATQTPESLLPAAEADTRELWRVVSVDGSTRIFQTKPGGEPRSAKRTPVRRATPCSLDADETASTASFFDPHPPLGSPLIAESAPAVSLAGEADLSVELTSVTQAWPSLSPGIRGAVMALIRAASKARPARQNVAPLHE